VPVKRTADTRRRKRTSSTIKKKLESALGVEEPERQESKKGSKGIGCPGPHNCQQKSLGRKKHTHGASGEGKQRRVMRGKGEQWKEVMFSQAKRTPVTKAPVKTSQASKKDRSISAESWAWINIYKI